MSDTSRFETALASAESWASIGRRAEAQYWLGTVAKATATVPQLLRAADALIRVGDTDLVVVLMERASVAVRAQLAAQARDARVEAYAQDTAVIVEAMRRSFAGLQSAAEDAGRKIAAALQAGARGTVWESVVTQALAAP
jgi:hypothetical protein